MRVAIMGSGGVGGLVGARLAAEADVLFIARGAHLTALREHGLRLESELGGVDLPRVDATDNPVGAAPVDVVIFTVKARDTPGAAALIAPLVGPGTAIISFQNGVDGVEELARHYGAGAVLPGTTLTAGKIEAPGLIRHVGTKNHFTFGEWSGEVSPRAEAFRDLATRAGLNVILEPDPHQAIWTKFAQMATMSALTCLTRLPVRAVAAHPGTRALLLEGMAEVAAVARARGIALPEDLAARMVAIAAEQDPSWKTSMCNDLEAGRPIEIDATSGAILRMGQELGVPTPVHGLAARVLQPFATGA